MPKKMMFARPDFSTFLICCSGDFSDNKSDEKPSVAICGRSICILTGLVCVYVHMCIKCYIGIASPFQSIIMAAFYFS